MTTVTPSVPGAAPRSAAASVAAQRARRLLVGGMAGAHLIALPSIAISALLWRVPGMVSAALGMVLVVLFYAIGQAVQIRVADAPVRRVMAAAVASYLVRISLFGLLLWGYFSLPAGQDRFLPMPLAGSAVLTVIGWLVGEVLVHRRLRVPNFDEPAEQAAAGER